MGGISGHVEGLRTKTAGDGEDQLEIEFREAAVNVDISAGETSEAGIVRRLCGEDDNGRGVEVVQWELKGASDVGTKGLRIALSGEGGDL